MFGRHKITNTAGTQFVAKPSKFKFVIVIISISLFFKNVQTAYRHVDADFTIDLIRRGDGIFILAQFLQGWRNITKFNKKYIVK